MFATLAVLWWYSHNLAKNNLKARQFLFLIRTVALKKQTRQGTL